MRALRSALALAGLVCAAAAVAPARSTGPEDFDGSFTGATLRIDLYHTGDRAVESFSLDSLREEGPWAGSRIHLVDETNFGSCLARVFDLRTNRLVFSRGYSSLFGEWRTTDEAKSSRMTMSESLLIPMPRSAVYVSLSTRDERNTFHEVFHLAVDPRSNRIVRERVCPAAPRESGSGGARDGIEEIAVTGPLSDRLDILFVADGYTAPEAEKFRRDARRFTRILLGITPFRENAGRINVRSLFVPSVESGTDEPRKGIYRATSAQTSFNTFGIERYLTAPDNLKLRDLAACAPYDRMIVLVNTSRYGGAGIHDLWAVTASDNEYSDYVTIHEFGHALAGLGDEYFTSSVAYNDSYPKGVEPWEPNITALIPDARPKWEAMLTPGVPIPTPVDAKRYGGSVVGAFEGAGYAAKDLYRPSLDCMMFSKGYAPFDPVCRRAVETILDRYAASPAR